MDRIATSMMIKGLLSLVILGLGVYWTGSIIWGVAGLALSWALILLTYDINGASMLLKTIPEEGNSQIGAGTNYWSIFTIWHEKDKLWKLLWLCLPLGFVMLVVTLKMNIPRYFIESYFGEWELGIYAAMSYVMVAGKQVVTALGHTVSPRLAKYFAKGEKGKFVNLFLKLILFGGVLGGVGIIVVAIAGKEILNILYRKEYAEYPNVFLDGS